MAEKKEQVSTKQQLPEAPAQASIRCLLDGYDVIFLTRGFNIKTVYDHTKQLIEWLHSAGAQPTSANNYNSSPKPKAEAKAEEEEREDWCSIHDCALPEWTSKDGKRKWRSHKIEGTDEWCKGK